MIPAGGLADTSGNSTGWSCVGLAGGGAQNEFKSLCGAKPPQKRRWTHAGRWLAIGTMEIAPRMFGVQADDCGSTCLVCVARPLDRGWERLFQDDWQRHPEQSRDNWLRCRQDVSMACRGTQRQDPTMAAEAQPAFFTETRCIGALNRRRLFCNQALRRCRKGAMPTACTPAQVEFPRPEGRVVAAGFDGGRITTDAGARLPGAADRVIGLTRRLAAPRPVRRPHLERDDANQPVALVVLLSGLCADVRAGADRCAAGQRRHGVCLPVAGRCPGPCRAATSRRLRVCK